MSIWDYTGYIAAGLVLVAFYMKDMVPLRLIALCSNLAFITYGCALGLTPIWLLHALLLPVNSCRLVEAARWRRRRVKIIRQNRAHKTIA